MTDISDEELERRMREQWFGSSSSKPSKPVLSDEDRLIAAKLMGKKNAHRLATTDRPFRYKPVVMIAEFYEHPQTGWRIDVIEDGERRSHRSGMTESECLKELRQLESKGATVRRFETEWMKATADSRRAGLKEKSPGKKTAIMNQQKEFRL
ncbi:hypothetical protein [Ochrobactrum sp. MYb379]|uniref:hypothetical protein n=1 Tax=Ochrobactrum sp. MYb379 TaxID=2745275 RepID=UPI0030A63CBD